MSIFSTDSKLYKAITWFGNIVMLNLCWLLFSLPVITIGASTVAAYSMMFKIMEDKEGYIFKGFLQEFKANWKQGTILWIITAAAGYAIYLDLQILINGDPSIPVIIASIVGIVIIFCALLYAFPLCARYENKFYMHIKNSFLLCANYLGRTLFLLVVLAVEVGFMFWNTTTLILVIIIGPMIFIATVAGTSKKIFIENDRKNGVPEHADPDSVDERENLSIAEIQAAQQQRFNAEQNFKNENIDSEEDSLKADKDTKD